MSKRRVEMKVERVRHSMSQTDLANALGVTASTVHHWETGASSPDVRMAKRIADVLHVDVSTVVGWFG